MHDHHGHRRSRAASNQRRLLIALALAGVMHKNGINARLLSDQSVFIEASISEVRDAALIGAILAVLVLPLLPRSGDWVRLGPWQVVVVLFIAGGYGIVDELHQASVPGRVSSLGDILTDLGAVASTLVVAGYVGSADATTRGLTIRLVSCTVFVLALVLHATFE